MRRWKGGGDAWGITFVFMLLVMGGFTEWLARAKDPQSVLLVPLGRARTPRDEARVRRVRIVTRR